MFSFYFYSKHPKASNRITLFVLIGLLIITTCGYIYTRVFKNGGFYEKSFYQKVSGIQIPESSKLIESFDNGEWCTVSTFKLATDEIQSFVRKYNFKTIETGYMPTIFCSENLN